LVEMIICIIILVALLAWLFFRAIQKGWEWEFLKYALRFGITLAIVLPILFITQGVNAIKVFTFKLCLSVAGLGLAELLWLFYFKPVFHKTEELSQYEKRTILFFRGILYAALILALTLGL